MHHQHTDMMVISSVALENNNNNNTSNNSNCNSNANGKELDDGNGLDDGNTHGLNTFQKMDKLPTEQVTLVTFKFEDVSCTNTISATHTTAKDIANTDLSNVTYFWRSKSSSSETKEKKKMKFAKKYQILIELKKQAMCSKYFLKTLGPNVSDIENIKHEHLIEIKILVLRMNYYINFKGCL